MTQPDPWTIDPSLPPPPRPLRHARDLWVLTKQIDELSGEWTFPIFIRRAANFHFGERAPLFYEPISDFDRLGLEALLIQKANAYCPSPSLQQGELGVSVNVFPSIFGAAGAVIPMPEEGQAAIGRHYMVVDGVHDRDTIVVRNSWSGWQSRPWAYLTREYFDRYGEEGLLSRLWEFGPTHETADQLLRCEDKDEFVTTWRRKRRYGTNNSTLTTPNVRLKWYGCWSLQIEAPAEILMIELDRQMAIGIAIIVHRPDNSTSELSDLFIWPSYRRKGYGLLLERFAAERATAANSSRLAAYVWNSDAVKGKDRALKFLRTASYSEIEEFTDRQMAVYTEKEIK